MNNVDIQYLSLLKDILENGQIKKDRTGVGTKSVFGRQMRFDMREGFPLLTTKKIFSKAMIFELLWFLKGGDNIKYLVDNGVNIWTEWPHQRYNKDNKNVKLTLDEFTSKIKTDNEFAKVWGDLGPVYGKQWIDWKKYDWEESNIGSFGPPMFPSMKNLKVSSVNQITNLINDLKNNPDSRRIMVTAWNPGELDKQLLPPCHYGFQMWTRELSFEERNAHQICQDLRKDPNDPTILLAFTAEQLDRFNVPTRAISLMFNMRSLDFFIGAPFDIASYGLLLSMIAQCVNMVPEELIINSGDTHLYSNCITQAKEQLTRTPYSLPKLWLNPEIKDIFNFCYDDVKFIDYKSHPSIKANIAV